MVQTLFPTNSTGPWPGLQEGRKIPGVYGSHILGKRGKVSHQWTILRNLKSAKVSEENQNLPKNDTKKQESAKLVYTFATFNAELNFNPIILFIYRWLRIQLVGMEKVNNGTSILSENKIWVKQRSLKERLVP